MRPASPSDTGRLVRLMTEFYAESGYPCDPAEAARSFEELVRDDRLGRVWLIEADAEDAGYLALTLAYSMEFGGLAAFIDDLFIRPNHRGKGLGTEALRVAREYCIARGVRAIHLEVGHENRVAQGLYRKAGFVSNDRLLLTQRLPAPQEIR